MASQLYTLSVYIPHPTRDRLRELAEADGRSLASYSARVLEAHLKTIDSDQAKAAATTGAGRATTKAGDLT